MRFRQTLSVTAVSSTTPQSQASTSTQTIQQGPVGTPASTTGTPGAPIPYVYTTVIGGVTTTVSDTFTPTSPATTVPSAGASGTIINYSSWLSIYGPSSNAGYSMKSISHGVLAVLAVVACGSWIYI